jgi:hypothetical protein
MSWERAEIAELALDAHENPNRRLVAFGRLLLGREVNGGVVWSETWEETIDEGKLRIVLASIVSQDTRARQRPKPNELREWMIDPAVLLPANSLNFQFSSDPMDYKITLKQDYIKAVPNGLSEMFAEMLTEHIHDQAEI